MPLLPTYVDLNALGLGDAAYYDEGYLGFDWQSLIDLTTVGVKGTSDIIRASKGISASPYQYGTPPGGVPGTNPYPYGSPQNPYGGGSTGQVAVSSPLGSGFGSFNMNEILKWGAIGLVGLIVFKKALK